ncbi:hypothetical protein DPQ25_00950 [Hydrogeniiclostridium mannosilyticum]|uniref:Uncharacterized protein n=1 Tax=Hydrogeniiclostridium mannosilyticum TaxID=2764322 RepID=A0A328UFG8_9FIRM|nr:hypothetical protein DPQ25_00950 [Hydrogeniiclostridium mannosilyticum]
MRRECCNGGNGAWIALDNGDNRTYPQTVSFLVCYKWFRWAGPTESTNKKSACSFAVIGIRNFQI